MRRAVFRRISQVGIAYRDSALSEGHAGRFNGGDRLPWMEGNFDPLQSLDWQATSTVSPGPLPLTTHVFPWNESARRAGLKRTRCT